MSRSANYTEQTISIDSSGNSAAIDIGGRTLVSMIVEGDAAADYAWDARRTGGDWKQGVGTTYSGSSDHDDVIETAAEEVRLRCTSGTGGSNDEADILLMGSG